LGNGRDARLLRDDHSAARRLLEQGIALASSGPPVYSYCIGACGRLAETALALLGRSNDAVTKRSLATLAESACAVLKKAARVFPFARPTVALYRGLLDMALGRRGRDVIAEGWQAAARQAQQMGLPYPELRLLTAILRHQPDDEPGRRGIVSRVRDLAVELELDPETLAPISSRSPLKGGVEIEREVELPRFI